MAKTGAVQLEYKVEAEPMEKEISIATFRSWDLGVMSPAR